MKSVADVAEWCIGAALEFGNPALPVCQVFARYADVYALAANDEVRVCFQAEERALLLCLLPITQMPPVTLPIADGTEPLCDEQGVEAYGLERIAPGLWCLAPSLLMPGIIHALVVLYDVPNPAPWERTILTVAG